jgi:alkanesulfonate monooxygenase SsuD/methylene tetrahydromethanopterin reductase-like flavin-dependent oxidoreductase (luciferase family)
VTADHISGGRIELGLGAGWHQGEHTAHGFPFGSVRERFDRLEEQLEIVRRSWDPEPFDFEGGHYRLEQAHPLPKPVQQPHPPLIMGGAAGPRSAALAARWADEYNTVYATADQCRERRERVAAACAEAGRDPLPFSLMTAFAITGDHADRMLREQGVTEPPAAWLAGTPEQIAEQLRELEAAGVERVMLQHLLHRDIDAVEQIGRLVVPAVAGAI